MSFEEFAAHVREIESPETDFVTRRNADAWLSALRGHGAAWLSVIPPALSSNDPLLMTYSAQLLAYKTKNSHLKTETMLPLLEMAVSGLLQTQENDRITIRAVCTAVAVLLIKNLQLSDSLSVLVSKLSPQMFLELVTILPGECEDAYEREQRPGGRPEVGLGIKQQAGEWCVNIVAWLCQRHRHGIVQGTGEVQQQPQQHNLSLSEVVDIVRCWTAWVHWGALSCPAVTADQTGYLIRVSSFLLLSTPERPDVGAVGTESICEVIERLPEPSMLFGTVVQLVLEIPGLIAGWLSQQCDPGHVSYIFASFCSTCSTFITSSSQEATRLRTELLGMISMLVRSMDGVNGDGNLLDDGQDHQEGEVLAGDSEIIPMLDALADVLEAYLSPNDEDLEVRRRLTGEDFAAKAISVLLMSVQYIPGLRDQMVYPLGMCCEIIGPEKYLSGLNELCDGHSCVRGGYRDESEAARGVPSVDIEVILFAAWSAAHTLTEAFDLHLAPLVLGLWNTGLNFLHTSSQDARHDNGRLLPFLPYDLFCYFETFSSIIVYHYAENHRLDELVVTILQQQVTTAIHQYNTGVQRQSRRPELGPEMQIAAMRSVVFLFREVNSLPNGTETTRTLAPDFLAATDLLLTSMLVHYENNTSDLSSLLGIPVYYLSSSSAQAASGLLTKRILEPLALAAAGQRVEPLSKILVAVEAFMAAVEEEWDFRVDESSQENINRVVAETLLMPITQHWMAVSDSYLHAVTVTRNSTNDEKVRDEDVPALLASIMASCLKMCPIYIAPGINDVLFRASSIMLQPLKGSNSMHRVFCTALDVFGEAKFCNMADSMVAGFASVLGHSRVAVLGNPRQGDADPDLAEAILSIAAAYVRNLSSWLRTIQQHPGEQNTMFQKTVDFVFKLGIANIGCNHRDVAQRSLSLVLAIIRACRHAEIDFGALLDVATFYAPYILGQITIDVPRLPTAAALPKVVSILTEIVLLAESVVKRTMISHDALCSWESIASQRYKTEILSVLRNWTGPSDQGFDWEPAIEQFIASKHMQTHDALRRCIQVRIRHLYETSYATGVGSD